MINRTTARIICLLAAAGVLTYGMLQPIEADVRWIASLWLTAPLLLIAARLWMPPLPRGFAHHIQNLALVIGVGFVLIALQLLRQQFIRADEIYRFAYTDPQSGQTTSNVRPVIEALRVQRGKMFDRNANLLVDTRIAPGNYAVRTYPLAQRYDPRAFGHVVGFFSPRFGQSGLEATYGPYLDGERDRLKQLQDALLGHPPIGDDLQLTIDAQLQHAALQILGGRSGSIVVIEPRTGAVLALVSSPGFDPAGLAFDPSAERSAENERIDSYWRGINSEGAGQPLLNRAVQGRYAPGSTFKTITAVSALEHVREARPDEIDCPNTRETEAGAPPVVNALENLANLTGNPTDLERVYAYSCNTAFAEYALRLGGDRLAETARRFGIVSPRDPAVAPIADLQSIASLLYVDAGFLDRPAALADTGFGQGQLLVTPLQMAVVAAAIANDGIIMQPYLVDRVMRPDGTVVRQTQPRALRRATSSAIAARMRDLMRAGVSYGFGKAADAVPGVAVGGKSGTAEFPCPTLEQPGRLCAHAWFIAIAPVEQPRFAVVVMIEGGGEGSGAGAAAAGQVMSAAFQFIVP
ncbi:MAG TPA: penicillin-binding protein 2 [Roseiflexaceae bacterium]|nr:penicillin-binding protein 2 [Roseiflexaceae bacterium]